MLSGIVFVTSHGQSSRNKSKLTSNCNKLNFNPTTNVCLGYCWHRISVHQWKGHCQEFKTLHLKSTMPGVKLSQVLNHITVLYLFLKLSWKWKGFLRMLLAPIFFWIWKTCTLLFSNCTNSKWCTIPTWSLDSMQLRSTVELLFVCVLSGLKATSAEA